MREPDLFNEELEVMDSATNVMDLESVRGALDELFLLARHYRDSEKFLDLLKFVASFRRYSAFNAMLVYIQMPGAKYVLPAKRWLKEYGRVPVSHAQPLVMLRPMGPVMFGFDVSQTEGPDLPGGIDDPFEASGRLRDGEFELTISNAQRDGVKVNLRPLGSTLGGYVRNAASPYHSVGIGVIDAPSQRMVVDDENIPVTAEVTLNTNFSAETNFATLTHELGHLYCGHVGTSNPKWWPDRSTLDRNTAEFEAESVSYLVCSRAGIATPAVEYLHGYLGANEKVPNISLEVVFKAIQRIESMRIKTMKSRTSEAEDG